MLDQVEHLFEGVAWTSIALGVVGGGAVLFLGYEHGWPWVKAKFQSLWTSTESAFSQIEDLVHLKVEDVHVRVDELETHFSSLEERVQKLEGTVALAFKVPTPSPAPASSIIITPTSFDTASFTNAPAAPHPDPVPAPAATPSTVVSSIGASA